MYPTFYSLRLFSPVFGFGAEGVTIAAVGARVQKRLSMKCLKMKSLFIFNLTEQPVEQRVIYSEDLGLNSVTRAKALYPLIDYSTAIDSPINHS